jgi:hypothetical protein
MLDVKVPVFPVEPTLKSMDPVVELPPSVDPKPFEEEELHATMAPEATTPASTKKLRI